MVRLRTGGLWADRSNSYSYGHVVEWDADAVLDATQALTYSVVSQTAAGAFAINADSGVITVGDGSLLDSTMVLYGSSSSTTHAALNYPTILAGGSRLGLKHGQYLPLGKETPFSNVLYTTMARLKSTSGKYAVDKAIAIYARNNMKRIAKFLSRYF